MAERTVYLTRCAGCPEKQTVREFLIGQEGVTGNGAQWASS